MSEDIGGRLSRMSSPSVTWALNPFHNITFIAYSAPILAVGIGYPSPQPKPRPLFVDPDGWAFYTDPSFEHGMEAVCPSAPISRNGFLASGPTGFGRG